MDNLQVSYVQSPVLATPTAAESALAAAIDAIVYDSLRPVAAGLALLFFVFAVAYPLVLPRAIALLLSSVACATTAVFLLGVFCLHRGTIPLFLAHPFAFGVSCLTLANVVFPLFLVPNPQQTINLMLFVIGAGLWLLSVHGLLLIVALTWLGWGMVVWLFPSSGWTDFGFALFIATVLALLVHTVRLRIVSRMELMRLQGERERKALAETMQAAQQNEERFRLVTEATSDAIYDWNLKTGTIWRSEGYVRLLRPPAALSRREGWWETHLSPDDRARIHASLQVALEQRNRVWTSEYRFQLDDGTAVFLADHALIVYDGAGAPVRIVGAMSDITARIKAEEERRRYAERLAILREVDRAIQMAESPEAIAQAALPRLRQLIPCRRASVSLMDFSGRESFLLAVDVTGKTCFPTGTQLPFSALTIVDVDAFRKGQIVEVEDLFALTAPPSVGVGLQAEGIHAHLHIPLTARGETIGALSLAKEQSGAFSTEHKEIAQEVANSLAIALQQARLYTQVRQQAEDLERKVAERTTALQERQRFVEQITNTTPIILYLYDFCRDRIVYVNDYVTEALGYTPAGVIQAKSGNVTDFLHPEDRERVRTRLQHYVTAKDGEIFPLEYRLRHRNGEWRWVHDRATVFARTADGVPYRVLGSAQDITEQKLAEEKLRAAEEEYRAIFEHANIGIYRSSLDGRQLRANPALVQLNGYTSEEDMLPAVNNIATEWYVDPHRREEFARLLEEHGRVSDFESEIYRHKTRERIWITETAHLVRDKDGHPVYYEGTVQDITARKQAEEALRQAKEAAESAARVKAEFLSTMSHELRSPLQVIMGYTDLLCAGAFGQIEPRQQEVLHRLALKAGKLYDLITAVLDLAAMDAGRARVQRNEIVVASLLRELQDEFRELQQQSGVTWTWWSDPCLPSVWTDPGKLKIVLGNLIGNAVKFTRQGKIAITAQACGGMIEISVADTGIGIPEEALQRIFEPFYQLDSSSSRQYEGSGLGLHIVKRLLDLIGGSVTVESKLGCGSTFRVRLPQHLRSRPLTILPQEGTS
ncbi:MAG: PAS domain S-box protein [Candidatus Binatia bacterium]